MVSIGLNTSLSLSLNRLLLLDTDTLDGDALIASDDMSEYDDRNEDDDDRLNDGGLSE